MAEADLDTLLAQHGVPVAAPAGADLDTLLAQHGVPVAQKPAAPAPSLLGRAKDIGVSALKGVVSLPQGAVGALDIPTGGRVGKALQQAGVNFPETQKILEEQYSPAQKEAFEEVQKAEGFVPTLKAVAARPSVAAHTIIQSAPGMLGGAGVAKGLMKAAPKLSQLAAGAIGEGVVTAGQTEEQIREQSPTGLTTPGQSALAAGTGALTGLITGGAGIGARKLGVGDINTFFLGNRGQTVHPDTPAPTKGVVKRVLEEMGVEATQEGLQSAQEQATTNIATGKPWDEGVSNAAALGAVVGAGMAGPIAAVTPPPVIPAERKPEPAESENLLDLGGKTMADLNKEPVIPEDTLARLQEHVTKWDAATEKGVPVKYTPNLKEALTIANISFDENKPAAQALEELRSAVMPEKTKAEEVTDTLSTPLEKHIAANPNASVISRAALTAVKGNAAQPQKDAAELAKSEDVPTFSKDILRDATAAEREHPVEEEPQDLSQFTGEPTNALNIDPAAQLHGDDSARPTAGEGVESPTSSGEGLRESGQGDIQQEAPTPPNQGVISDQSQNAAPQKAAPETQEVEKPIDGAIAKEHPLHPANEYQEAVNPEDTKKAVTNFQDLPIAIENPKGSIRKGKGFETKMQDHYGEILSATGADEDAVDAFIPEGLSRKQIDDTKTAYIVDQIDPKTGKFDEHKVMLGYPSKEAAEAAYRRNYSADWKGLGAITEMPIAAFKDWVKNGNTKAPVSGELNHWSAELPKHGTQVGEPTPKASDEEVDAVAQKAIAGLKDKNIDGDFDIPYVAGYSADGHTLYMDKDVPEEYWPHIAVHEAVEKALEDDLGEDYFVAHQHALKYERAAVEKAGLEWNKYNAEINPLVKKDEHKSLTKTPSDLDLKPYEDEKDYERIKRIRAAAEEPRFSRPNDQFRHNGETLLGLFTDLDSRSPRVLREKAKERIKDHPLAERIQYVEDNFIDFLVELETQKRVKIKC